MATRYYPSLGKDVIHPAAATAIRQVFDHVYTLLDQVQALKIQVATPQPLTAAQIAQAAAAMPTPVIPATLVTRVTTLPAASLSYDGQQVIFNGKVYWFDGSTQTWIAFS